MTEQDVITSTVPQVPDVVCAAIVSNKPSVVSKWLSDLTIIDESVLQKLKQILLYSVELLNVDVVKLFRPPILSRDLLYKLINTVDHNGMTVLHFAGKACQPNKDYYAILEVLAYLCEQGGDPAVFCKGGRTAKMVAEENCSRMAGALLELLENIHSRKSQRSLTPNYEDINVLHKTILHWAVGTGRHEIVSHILTMHQRDTYDNIAHLLFDIDPYSVQCFQEAPIYTTVKIGNPTLLQALIGHSGIILSTIVGQRQKRVIPRPDGTSWVSSVTPLSLILSASDSDNLVDVLVKCHKSVSGQNSLSIDLSNTTLFSLPATLFKLTLLSNLNVSDNEINELPFSSLPSDCWPNMLEDFNVSHNKLEHIPSELFNLPCLKVLNVSYNPLKSFPREWWTTKSIVTLNVSHTHLESLSIDTQAVQTRDLPSTMPRNFVHGQFTIQKKNTIPCRNKTTSDTVLQHLNCSHCRINVFPGLLAFFFPNLEVLNLSSNKLQSCCAINELPTSLVELDISDNLLCSGKHRLFYRDIHMLNSTMRHGELSNLKFLKLANNVYLKTLSIHDDHKYENDRGVRIFFPKLVRLNLANCGLKESPKHLVELQKLTDLNLSHNRELTIPREVCNLEILVNFDYDGIEDPIVNSLNLFTNTKDKQIFLREEHVEKRPSIKLIFVGHNLINLPSCLTEKKVQDKGISLEVIDQHTWCISKSKTSLVSITYNIWNFIGVDEYAPASQCFLAGNAMFVLCWNITNGQDNGVSQLRNWLLNIQDRAKGTSVILVGCHTTSIGGRLKRHLVNQVQDLCQKNSFCFPNIANIKFVSTATLEEDMVKICNCLYESASSLRVSLGSKFFTQPLKDMTIPVSYFALQRMLTNKVALIKNGKEKGPPIITWDDIVRMTKLHKSGKPLFRDQRELKVAVDYMIESGIILHYDYPIVSDCYFIDPHWLYNVFCQVCRPPSTQCSSRIGNDDGKVHQSYIQQLLFACNIPEKHFKPIIKLLHRFDIAIPLDSDTLLLPSTLSTNPHNKLYSSVNCQFPGDRAPKTPSVQKTFSFSNLLSVATCTLPTPKNINLQFTNMCYRRLFLSHHVPENFWSKLIPRFISSAKNFYDILLNNCVEGMTIERMANVGDAVICNHHCRWLYWSNGITLTFGDYVLLCVNGLMQASSNAKDEGRKIPLSVTVHKIKTMRFFNGRQWGELFHDETDGFEVNVPDYVVHSSVESECKTYTSIKLGPQILSHILEILNELCAELFKSLSEKGIYSDSFFSQLVVCPLCYGDTPGEDCGEDELDDEQQDVSMPDTLHSLFGQSIKPFDVTKDITVPKNVPFGFSVRVCILNAQKECAVFCPDHGKIKLKYLTPDLVFYDIMLKKVRAIQVGNKLKQLGQGGYSTVYKVKLVSDHSKDVALKCFTNWMINGKLRDLSLQDLTLMYSDLRLELNKLSTVDHPHIVQFLGLCMISFSLVLEWAPKGNLEEIITEYRLANTWMCPDTVAKTAYQVSSALSYLHREKNIVHFDIKPANVLVFKYPQAGHFCFSKETSLSCESCYSEGGGVLVKLADLGISALVGPSGFQRSVSTPVYVAPEVLKYQGKEPLVEKVDIFSLGMSLYEVVTLRKLPPGGSQFDFNADIAAGRRPEFLPEDPNYPLPLIECVQGCWAQDYTQRPTAKKIEDGFKSPNCLRLKNSYKLKSTTVHAVLVTKVVRGDVKEELIWVASRSRDDYKLVSYTFVEQEDAQFVKIVKQKKVVHPKLCVTGDPIKLNGQVKAMCQHGIQIWILYDSGTLAICDVNNYKMIKDVVLQDIPNKPVTMLVVDHSTGLITTAYANGLIVFLWGKNVTSDDYAVRYFHSSTTITVSWRTFKLHTIETCSVSDGHSQLWCSYDIGVIQIVKPPVSTSGETEIVKVVEIKEYCTDLPHDTSIVQLKCSPNQDQKSTVMYALHDGGLAISCWSVDVDPKLYTIIKPSLSNPVTTLLPIHHAVYIGTKKGIVCVINTEHILEEKYDIEILAGAHLCQVEFLVVLQGTINAQGFLSSCGVYTAKDKQARSNSMYYARQLDSVPCTVLMSIGVGYQELFTSNTSVSSCLIKWALPC